MTVNGWDYWIWARDVAGNDTHVWKGNGEVLPDNSALWAPGQPNHGSYDCVELYEVNGKLYDLLCSATRYYICEAA